MFGSGWIVVLPLNHSILTTLLSVSGRDSGEFAYHLVEVVVVRPKVPPGAVPTGQRASPAPATAFTPSRIPKVCVCDVWASR